MECRSHSTPTVDLHQLSVQQCDLLHTVDLPVNQDIIPHIVRVLHEQEQHALEHVLDRVAKHEGEREQGGGEGGEAL